MGTTTLLTFAEFEALPDSPGKRELLDGELIEMPPPKTRHIRIQHRIHELLKPYVTERVLGKVYIEAGYKLGERHWVQPDVSLVSTKQEQNCDFRIHLAKPKTGMTTGAHRQPNADR